MIKGPLEGAPADVAAVVAAGADFWPLRFAREFDDALLHLRLNERDIGLLAFHSEGRPESVLACDALLDANAGHWLVREIRLYLKRVLKRLDLTSRSLVALIEPGSCFAGALAEIVLACDRSYMLQGQLEGGNRTRVCENASCGILIKHPVMWKRHEEIHRRRVTNPEYIVPRSP